MSNNPFVDSEFQDAKIADELAVADALSLVSGAPSGNSFPFEAMNLRVGDRLQVQPPEKLSSERCIVRLLGYFKGSTLLVTAPQSAPGVRLQLIEGERLVIRVFSSQNAFAFGCEVVRICKLPYHYLHLSFPSEVQGTVIRKAPRVKTKISASVTTAQGDKVPGIISNLSANGALLDAKRDLVFKGESLTVTFRVKLHQVESQLTVNAVVRAVFSDDVMENTHAKLSHFGLEFSDLAPNDHMVLQGLVYQQMIERPDSLV